MKTSDHPLSIATPFTAQRNCKSEVKNLNLQLEAIKIELNAFFRADLWPLLKRYIKTKQFLKEEKESKNHIKMQTENLNPPPPPPQFYRVIPMIL